VERDGKTMIRESGLSWCLESKVRRCIDDIGRNMMFTRHADKWLSRDHEIENVIYVCSLCTDEPKNAGDHDNLDATAMKLNALTPTPPTIMNLIIYK